MVSAAAFIAAFIFSGIVIFWRGGRKGQGDDEGED
jgi:hypothetical protein